jgi:hypothetical protein
MLVDSFKSVNIFLASLTRHMEKILYTQRIGLPIWVCRRGRMVGRLRSGGCAGAGQLVES